jgi:hypothetical protein
MDQHRFIETQYRIEHRHKDGTWAKMVEDREHESADHDEERAWANRRIYKCASCDEAVTVLPGAEGGAVEPR